MKKLDPKDWSPFWQKKSLTSFGDLFPDNYDGSILDFWQSELVGDLNHVVDLACGNGALTWICNDILNSEQARTKITGIDIADISPFRVLKKTPKKYPAIQFIGRTPIENLPFPDNSIDLFVSQYGLEYSNLEKTIPELGKKLLSCGRISLILHDQESSIIQGATEHLKDFHRVMDEIRLHDLAFVLDNLFEKYKNPVTRSTAPEYCDLMSKIKHASARVDSLARLHPGNSPLHLYVRRLNSAFETPNKRLKSSRKKLISHARDAFNSHIERVEDLKSAALSASDREKLVSLIHAEGMEVTKMLTLEYNDQKNLGTIFTAER